MMRRFSTSACRAAIRSTRGRPKAEPKEPKESKVEPREAPVPDYIQSVPSIDFEAAPDAHAAPTPTILNDPTVVATLEQLEQPADRADWSTSFAGLGSAAFSDRAIGVLLAPVVAEDVEITPDGLLYLPEIKYRRILNRAFGPGGWGIAPRTKTLVTNKKVTREYGLVCQGRLVSISRGEMDFFNQSGITTAMEGCKSNALMRCCKDLGIASELWDPAFIRDFKKSHCDQKYFDKKKRFVWKRKDRPWEYPYV